MNTKETKKAELEAPKWNDATTLLDPENGYWKMLEIGDLIEFQRTYLGKNVYNHWVVYIGNMEVIEARPQKNLLKKLAKSDWIKKISLQEATDNSRWRINHFLDEMYPPFEKEEIRKRAEEQLDPKTRTFPCYELTTSNCEHFCHLVRNGKSVSIQVEEKKLLHEVGKEILSEVGELLGTLVINELPFW